MKLLLIRHGQSMANIDGLVCGQMDSPLSSLGRRQALGTRRLIEDLSLLEGAKAFASPLSRAWETGEIAYRRNSLIKVPALMELDTGSTNFLTYPELFEVDPRYALMHQHPELKFPDGESVLDMYKRVTSWFRTLVKSVDEDMVFFAHAYSLNCLIHDLTGEPLSTFPKFQLPNGGGVLLTLERCDDERMVRATTVIPVTPQVEAI